MLFTCRPLAGHFEPLLPLAREATTAGSQTPAAPEPLTPGSTATTITAHHTAIAGPPDSRVTNLPSYNNQSGQSS